MEQIGIAIFGVVAVWLSQDANASRRKYAPIFGLCSQPFWFYTAYINQQWGVLFLSLLYTVSWIKGIHTYWVEVRE